MLGLTIIMVGITFQLFYAVSALERIAKALEQANKLKEK